MPLYLIEISQKKKKERPKFIYLNVLTCLSHPYVTLLYFCGKKPLINLFGQ